MTECPPRVIIIPANPELAKEKAVKRQLRVAAYCRVSTDEEEQLSSYEAQQTYYTDKIMSNPAWTMAGLFADQGITGTSARKRPEFLRMIRWCKQKKIEICPSKLIQAHDEPTVFTVCLIFGIVLDYAFISTPLGSIKRMSSLL